MKLLSPLSLMLIAAAFLAIPVPAASQGPIKLKTVVIDPGHGGKDAGCVSRDKKTYEKNIALDIALRLNRKIASAFPDVDVKMTRSDDHFVELEQRAVFANKANANLFISVHVNSVERGTSANGFSVHVLGQSQRRGNDLYSKNLDLVKRENSVIMLEDNFETRYQGFDPNDPQSSIIFSLMQNAHLSASLAFAEDVAGAMAGGPIRHSRGVSQDPFWVLWRTAMPSVLIEVGFMSNPDDLAVMRSEAGRQGIADNIFKAFCIFKTRYDGSASIPPVEDVKPVMTASGAPSAPATAPAKKNGPQDGVLYGIQVLAIGKRMESKDPFFKGYEPMELKVGNLYKYIICPDTYLSQAKKSYEKVSSIFKDSYLVKVENGVSSPVR